MPDRTDHMETVRVIQDHFQRVLHLYWNPAEQVTVDEGLRWLIKERRKHLFLSLTLPHQIKCTQTCFIVHHGNALLMSHSFAPPPSREFYDPPEDNDFAGYMSTQHDSGSPVTKSTITVTEDSHSLVGNGVGEWLTRQKTSNLIYGCTPGPEPSRFHR